MTKELSEMLRNATIYLDVTQPTVPWIFTYAGKRILQCDGLLRSLVEKLGIDNVVFMTCGTLS